MDEAGAIVVGVALLIAALSIIGRVLYGGSNG
jgi:hypothetical protein